MTDRTPLPLPANVTLEDFDAHLLARPRGVAPEDMLFRSEDLLYALRVAYSEEVRGRAAVDWKKHKEEP